jgi:hypothetical protein
MLYNFILTGKSVNALKFDDLGCVEIENEERLVTVANAIALRVRQERRQRKVVSAFRIDEDMACYTVFDCGGCPRASRNFGEARNYKSSASTVERRMQDVKVVA